MMDSVYDLTKTDEYLAKNKKWIPGGVNYNFYKVEDTRVIYYKSGNGSRLTDVDGNEYIDLYGKSGTMILGHNHLEYNQLLCSRINTILSVNDSASAADVCEQINAFVPSCEMFRFGLSGTEVIQNAFRLARSYTGKQKIIRFWGHFHGNADNVLGDEYDTETYRHMDTGKTALSTSGRFIGSLEECYILPWNNITILKEFLIKKSNEVAAIIMEPIMINNGGFMPEADYLNSVKELCTKHGVLLIFDEIISGFRVSLGGAQGLFGIKPDLTILGKAMSNGAVPVSAIGGIKDVMRRYESNEVVNLGTYNGYPLGFAAIGATLGILKNDKEAYSRMESYSKRIKEIILEEAGKTGIALYFEGHPLSMCFHTKEEKLTEFRISRRDSIRKSILRNAFLSHGIILAPPTRIYLNTSFNDNDLDFFTEKVKLAFSYIKNSDSISIFV